jgi:uncharacterized integral membrane protein
VFWYHENSQRNLFGIFVQVVDALLHVLITISICLNLVCVILKISFPSIVTAPVSFIIGFLIIFVRLLFQENNIDRPWHRQSTTRRRRHPPRPIVDGTIIEVYPTAGNQGYTNGTLSSKSDTAMPSLWRNRSFLQNK